MNNYKVCYYNFSDGGELYYVGADTFTDIEEAIVCWMSKQAEYRTTTEILTFTKQEAKALLDWCIEHQPIFEALCDMYKIPYKKEYLIDSIKRNDLSSFYEGLGYSIEPFTMG